MLLLCVCLFCFFFFKQKTAYEMRISDWSSDVCSSDLAKRSQLGAHYTDRDKIMMIVRPVIIEPLEAEWAEVREKIASAMDKVAAAKARVPKTQSEARKVFAAARRAEEAAYREAQRLRNEFLVRLKEFRVLDPA